MFILTVEYPYAPRCPLDCSLYLFSRSQAESAGYASSLRFSGIITPELPTHSAR